MLFHPRMIARRELRRITDDGGLVKSPMAPGDPCKLPPSWKSDSVARIHYRLFTVPLQQQQDATNLFKHGQALIQFDDRNDAYASAEKIDIHRRQLIGDSKWDGRPLEVRIGRGFSVQALEIAVKTMRIGEKARFFALPQYAEMEALLKQDRLKRHQEHKAVKVCCGCADMKQLEDLNLLFGCPLEFQLELVDVLAPDKVAPEPWQLSANELWQAAQARKTNGDDHYRSQAYAKAIKSYSEAADFLKRLSMKMDQPDDFQPPQPSDEHRELELKCYLNLAACHLQVKEYTRVVQHCLHVLQSDPHNTKALFRRGKAYRHIGRDLELAAADLDACVQSIHDDPAMLKEVQQERRLLAQQLQAHDRKEARLFKNILT